MKQKKDIYLHQRWLQKYTDNDKKDVYQYLHIASSKRFDKTKPSSKHVAIFIKILVLKKITSVIVNKSVDYMYEVVLK